MEVGRLPHRLEVDERDINVFNPLGNNDGLLCDTRYLKAALVITFLFIAAVVTYSQTKN